MTTHTETSTCVALVTGAGPVGLTMALELSRQGVPCRIVDAAPAATDKSKALVLWGRTLELLNRSGDVTADFVPRGIFARAVNIYGNGHRLVHMPFEREDTAFPQPLMIPQCDTEQLLAQRLAARGITIERSVELIDFADHGTSVEAALRHPDGSTQQVSCRWLLGCDGSHSLVRKKLGIEFSGEFDPNDWILADLWIDGPLPNDELSIYWHSQGIVAFFPIGGGRFRIVADQGEAASTSKPADPSLADVEAVLAQRGLTGLRLRDPYWLAGFRIHERKVEHYGAGRVFLAGDAAHIHSPAGGQGMNTGMQDAVNLAWKLALVERGCGRRDRLLGSYSQERSDVGDMVLRGATNLTRLATMRNPLLQFIRNRGFSLVGSFSAVQHRAIAALSEMAVHYPHSPLSCDDGGRAYREGIACGERLPDAEVLAIGDPKPQQLLAALSGLGHHLLIVPDSSDAQRLAAVLDASQQVGQCFGDVVTRVLILPEGTSGTAAAAALRSAGDVTVLCDVAGQVRRRLGIVREALVLVRPDGYVSFRGHGGSWNRLEAHLATLLVPMAQRTGAAAATC